MRPPVPRKLRLLRNICLGLALAQALYVIALSLMLPPSSTPGLVIRAFQASGCRVNPSLADFCHGAALSTSIGIVVPSVYILCLWGTYLIVPLGPLFLLTRNRADRLEMTQHLDTLKQRRGRPGWLLPIYCLIAVLACLVFASLGPSVEACHSSNFKAQLIRLCPEDSPLRALVIPVIYLCLCCSWVILTYAWRPWRRDADVPAVDEETAVEEMISQAITTPPAGEPAPPRRHLNPPAPPAKPSFGKRAGPVG